MRRTIVACAALCAAASTASGVGSAGATDGTNTTSTAEARRQAIDGATDSLDQGPTSDPRLAILDARATVLLSGKTDVSARPEAPGVISTTPEITAPVDGASVSGVLTASATSTAPQVRFAAAGREVTVPTVDGVASTPIETWGVTGGQQITAVDCDDVECGTSADSVTVTVANAAVAIDQPVDGSAVGTSVVVVVSAPGGGVRFLLDGTPVGDVASAPYQATVDTSALSPGAHTLGAVQCDTTFTSCAGRAAEPVTIRVRNELAPDITSVRPSLFSPNGDGRRDTTTVHYSLDTRQDVTWRVLDRRGSTVRGPVQIGAQGEGDHSLVFNGKDRQGDPLRSGGYRIRLATTKAVGGTEVTGQAEASMVIDTKAPRATDVRATPGLFYPVRDHYRDTTEIRTRLTADAAWLKAVVENASGHTVRVDTLRSHDRGRHQFTWNGRASNGTMVSPGQYRVRFQAQDTAGNRSTSGAARIQVSGKRLHRHSASETVLPKPNHIATLIGSCSRAATPARAGWDGSIGYYSNWEICLYPTDQQLLAFTRHSIAVPRAVRYGNFRVSTYGGRSVAGFPDKGIVLYENRRSDITSRGGVLRPGTGWHRGQAVDGDAYVTGSHQFRWWGGTGNSWFYDIKQFRVSYSWFTLE